MMSRKSLTCGVWQSGVVLLALTVLATSGCNDNKKRAMADDNCKQLSVALIAYTDANGGAWPDSLDQVKPLIGKTTQYGVVGMGKDFATLIANPLTGDNPGYEYVKPKDKGLNNIVLYQLRGGKRDNTLSVAYADGSVRPADKAAP
jgi:hypothetical protein